MNNRTRLMAVIALIAIGLAACATAQGSDASADPTDVPPVAGMCAEDQPDCQDMVTVPDDGTETPDIRYRMIEPVGDVAGDGVLLNDGELIAVDGNTITIGFWMGVEDCYAVKYVDVEETESEVTVSISIAARDSDAVCIEIAEARSVTVELAEPLGERALQIGDVAISG